MQASSRVTKGAPKKAPRPAKGTAARELAALGPLATGQRRLDPPRTVSTKQRIAALEQALVRYADLVQRAALMLPLAADAAAHAGGIPDATERFLEEALLVVADAAEMLGLSEEQLREARDRAPVEMCPSVFAESEVSP